LDVHSYPMDKVDSPMWTQYFDGKLGHVWVVLFSVASCYSSGLLTVLNTVFFTSFN